MYITPCEIWCWSQCCVCVLYRSSSTETNALCCSGCIFAYINGMYLPHPQTNKQTRSTHHSLHVAGAHTHNLCTSMLSAPGGVVPYGASSASSFNARSRTPFNNSNALSHHGQSSRINIVMRPILHVYYYLSAKSATRQEGFRFVVLMYGLTRQLQL